MEPELRHGRPALAELSLIGRIDTDLESLTLVDATETGHPLLNPIRIDVTHRVLMEALRMSPIVAMSMRTVMNTCVVEGYELPAGGRLLIAQTAPHYLEEAFPDPQTFDIDRYAPPRNERVGAGYALYGLGTHSCLGLRWAQPHLVINLLMLTHSFKIELARPYKRLPMDPLPSQSPSNKLKFKLVEQRHELDA